MEVRFTLVRTSVNKTMLRRALLVITLIWLSAVSIAQEVIGLYMQGELIGFSRSSSGPDTVAGKPMTKQVSRTYMKTGLLGSPVVITIDIVTWIGSNGKPTLMKYDMVSAGRSNKVEANYVDDKVHLTIDNSGDKSRKTLAMPKDAPIVDDALNALLESGAGVGVSRKFYVLDPMTASFVLNTVTAKGKTKATVDGKEIDANLVEVVEPRMTMRVFLSEKGDFLYAEALGQMEMRPITPKQAEEFEASDARGTSDLAEATRIRVTPPLGNPAEYRSATYRFEGGTFGRAPQDASQRFRQEGSAWIATISPVVPQPKGAVTIQAAAKQQPTWTAAGLNIPSGDPNLKKLARGIVGKETNSVKAALLLGRHVHSIMRPNAGIGVLRNANEILRTKEGVCRDYAILLATLMRSAGMPARVASGLVYQDGSFYYHAWVESWDGARWFGVDATRPNLDVTPGHIKLAQGTVEDAFMFTFLDRASVKVIRTERKGTSG